MTTTATNKTIFTPDDLLRLPDSASLELVDGQLVEKNVSIESSRIGARIGKVLSTEAERTNQATVFGSDLGYQCFKDAPNKIRKPDVSLVRQDRMAPLQGDRGYMPIPADLAVEVVSPNDLWYDVNEKVEEYLRAGFGLVWVVDPNTRTVNIHRADGSAARLHENDDITGETALPGFRCRVAEFFALTK